MKKIILASTSVGRKKLMETLKIPFEVMASDFEEDMGLQMTPSELALFLSHGKAQAVANKNADAIVIGTDTFVVFKNKLLGKPRDDDHAKEMLRSMRGNKHSVMTGITVIEGSKIVKRVVETDVYMKSVSDEIIDMYVESGESKGRAGAYGIQGNGREILVEKIEGQYHNIIGLPLETLVQILNDNFGMELTFISKE